MNLKSRLAALESKRQPSDPLRIFITRPGQSEDAITGFYIAGDTATLREPNETLEALQERAAATVDSKQHAAIFRPIIESDQSINHNEAHHHENRA